MHPIIKKIKQECWDGEDRIPGDAFGDSCMVSAEGIQKQIDAATVDVIMIFALNNEGKIRKYIVSRSEVE